MANPYQNQTSSGVTLNKLKFIKRSTFLIKSIEDVEKLFKKKLERFIRNHANTATKNFRFEQTFARGIVQIVRHSTEELIRTMGVEFSNQVDYAHKRTSDMLKKVLPAQYFEHVAGGLLLQESADYLADIETRDALRDIERRIVDEDILPSPTAEETLNIIRNPNGGVQWDERIMNHSKLITNPIAVSEKISQLVERGIPAEQWTDELLPLVGSNAASAKRVARNESQRIMNETTMKTAEGLDDLLIGWRYSAVLDSVTRPWHAELNGVVYYTDQSRRPNTSEMPVPPWEPNCRCWLDPVFEDEEVVRTEAGNRALKTPEGEVIESVSVENWFSTQSDRIKADIVGKNRFNLMKDRLETEPNWSDFVNPVDSRLMPFSELQKETAEGLGKRVSEVRSKMIDENLVIARSGLSGNLITDPAQIRKTVNDWAKATQLPRPFGVNMGISDADVRFESAEPMRTLSDMLGKNITSEDLATMAGSPSNAIVDVFQDENQVVMRASNEVFTSIRSIPTGQTENFIINNQGLAIAPSSHDQAVNIIAREMQHVQRLGFKKARIQGVNTDVDQSYHTWSQLGYNASFPVINGIPINNNFRSPFNLAKDVRELIVMDGGLDFWLENGSSSPMEFDLTKNSESFKMLESYRKIKSKRKNSGAIRFEEQIQVTYESAMFAQGDPDLIKAFNNWRTGYIKRMKLNSDGTPASVDPFDKGIPDANPTDTSFREFRPPQS